MSLGVLDTCIGYFYFSGMVSLGTTDSSYVDSDGLGTNAHFSLITILLVCYST